MDAGALAHLILKLGGQILGVSRQCHIQGDGQIGLHRTGGHHGTAQIELLPHRAHQVHVAGGGLFLELPGHLHQGGTGAPVVHGGASDLGAAQLLEGGLVNHGAAHINAHVVDLLGAGGAHINKQGGHQVHFVFLLRRGGVVGLGPEYAGVPLAVLAADDQLQAGEHLLWNAAQAVHLVKPTSSTLRTIKPS